MTSSIVAKRYAKALLEIGREDGNYEKYAEEVAAVVALFDTSPELESVLSNPALDLQSRKGVLQTLLEKLQLSPITTNFFRLLMDRGRIDQTREISVVYGLLLDEVKGITRAEVTSAASLSDQELDRLKDALKAVAGKEVSIELKEDPSLIGGIKARIGDLVLDGSVRTQLESLKESLRKGEYA